MVRACKLFLCSALIVCFTFTLVGCNNTNSTSNFSENFVGTWRVTDVTNSLLDLDENQAKALNSAEKSAELTVKEDKTFTFDILGTTLSGTWEAKDEKSAKVNISGIDVDATIDSDGTLSLEYENSMIAFTKK